MQAAQAARGVSLRPRAFITPRKIPLLLEIDPVTRSVVDAQLADGLYVSEVAQLAADAERQTTENNRRKG
jgi:hypothetical protein